jgi:hypothetical protein
MPDAPDMIAEIDEAYSRCGIDRGGNRWADVGVLVAQIIHRTWRGRD